MMSPECSIAAPTKSRVTQQSGEVTFSTDYIIMSPDGNYYTDNAQA